MHLKPQDVLIALRLAAMGDEPRPPFAALARELGISVSETHAGIERLKRCALMNPVLDRVDRSALRNFLVHGLRHVFPAVLGAESKGVPTAASASPLKGQLVSEARVWKSGRGDVRGRAVEPLYPSVPEAAKKNRTLHELLALADALRIGQARERKLAVAELEKRL
ncbi:MAG: hypothetical protein K1X64_16210 [Myxococcaceae bacterium]|nr:hypothetical protein [Myxococcaceae bacterium]